MQKLVTDELWAPVEPLLPQPRVSRNGGRPAVPDRDALAGVLFVLRSGIPRRMLPVEMGCGWGVTCWRRLRAWQRRGVWKRLHRALLNDLAAADRIDWTRAALDSRSLAAKKLGAARGRNPTDKEKRLEATSAGRRPGHPRAGEVTAVSQHDSRILEPMLDGITPLRTGRRGGPRRWPAKLHAGKGCDFRRCRDACVARRIQHRITRRASSRSTPWDVTAGW